MPRRRFGAHGHAASCHLQQGPGPASLGPQARGDAGNRILMAPPSIWPAPSSPAAPLSGGTTPNRVYRIPAGGGGTAVVKFLTLRTPEMRAQGERELAFYGSGLPARLPQRCRAPRLLAVPSRKGDWVRLTLEDTGPTRPRTLRSLARCAADLAHLHAAFWDRIPEEPWMLPAGGRVPPEPAPEAVTALAAGASDPRTATALAEAHRPLARLLERLERLRRECADDVETLAHGDYWSANLTARRAGTIAFDWSDVGPSAAGEDLGVMAWTTVWFGVYPWRSFERLQETLIEAYRTELGHLRPDAPGAAALRAAAERAILGRFHRWALVEELPALLGARPRCARWPRRGAAFLRWWAAALGGMADRWSR